VLTRARRFLDAVAPDDPLSLVLADSLEALPDALAAAGGGPSPPSVPAGVRSPRAVAGSAVRSAARACFDAGASGLLR
ncbi:hypothetical protein, partial [Nocardia brasiliensis]|uniref:hypothetical protein n=1 Tax=Nocardia brasiliensis TaxID=37326 RepID=UPI00245519B9